MFLLVHTPVANEQSLAVHDHFHLFQIVVHKGRAAADNVEDSISQTNARANLHTARDNMYVSFDVVLCHKATQDTRIAGGYLFTVEPLKAGIVDTLRDSKGETAPR